MYRSTSEGVLQAQVRTAVLSVRVSVEQRAALERLAQHRSQVERRNVDVSEVVRELIDKETSQK
jgi:hypothetical protein